ncbi:MAG: BrnT family toxin [Actinobacteria bacterium]|nr:BrnT family toxin [Actinomycetota bacterium]
MGFEFDPAKSASNRAKHGIEFIEAQALWDDARSIELATRGRDESRSIVIGRIDGRLWAAIFTHRFGAIRIISVRRARTSEEALYEG